MKTLYLMRHAKSDLSDTDQDDMHRPLNRRGERAASLVGIYLAQQGYPVRGIFCSPATRTETTARRVRDELAGDPKLVTMPNLYSATYDSMIDWLQGLGDAPDHILVVGHNPSLEDLSSVLVTEESRQTPVALRMAEKLPTAGLAILKLPIDNWSDLKPGIAELTHFVRPKDLI